MKPLLAILAAALLGACATNPQVGPKPNTAPVRTSNAATRQSIKKTQTNVKQVQAKLKEAQTHEQAGATALQKADDLLSQMINKGSSK